jgi:hypothetical protein
MSSEKPMTKIVAVPCVPHKIEVEGFQASYAKHTKEHAYQWMWFGIPSIILFLIGAITVLFGPSRIYYDTLAGPTLFQFIQMYPGPIAMVGGLLFSLNGWLVKSSIGVFLEPSAYLLANYNVEIAGEPLDHGSVGLKYIENGEFEFFELKEDVNGPVSSSTPP